MPFSRLRKGAFCIFLNPRLNGKPGVVHLYWQLMALRDGCFAFQGRNRLEEGAGGVLAGRYGYVRLPEGRDL